MTQDRNMDAAKEQLERRRLNRLIDALPVFVGYVSPDGHMIQSHPKTDEAFLWSLPAFGYGHDSITQIVDMCERAATGQRVQIERSYLKSSDQNGDVFGRGLLTLTPSQDEEGHVEELTVSLIDCDDAGLIPYADLERSRLSEVNTRIESMLSLAQTVIEVSRSGPQQKPNRQAMTGRLDTLASIIDLVSDPDQDAVRLNKLVDIALQSFPNTVTRDRLKRATKDGSVPVANVPLLTLLLFELASNARQHGAWRETSRSRLGTVSLESELSDGRHGRVLRLHWIEDGGPPVSAVLPKGFGFVLGERLFAQITGGSAILHNSEDGLSWTFELPVAVPESELELGGVGL